MYVYIVGEASIEKYDVDQDQWTIVTHLSTSRSSSGVAVLDDKIYVSGGTGGEQGSLKNLECYNITDNSWTTLADMNHVRTRHSLLVIDGALVAVGGDVYRTTEEYNIADNTWTVRLEEDRLQEEVAEAFLMMGCHLLS